MECLPFYLPQTPPLISSIPVVAHIYSILSCAAQHVIWSGVGSNYCLSTREQISSLLPEDFVLDGIVKLLKTFYGLNSIYIYSGVINEI
jgi:hypothetical protein